MIVFIKIKGMKGIGIFIFVFFINSVFMLMVLFINIVKKSDSKISFILSIILIKLYNLIFFFLRFFLLRNVIRKRRKNVIFFFIKELFYEVNGMKRCLRRKIGKKKSSILFGIII